MTPPVRGASMNKGTRTQNVVADERPPIVPGPVIVSGFRRAFADELLRYIGFIPLEDPLLLEELDGIVYTLPTLFIGRDEHEIAAIVDGYLAITQSPELQNAQGKDIAKMVNAAYQAVIANPPAEHEPFPGVKAVLAS